jgi:spore maturation protein CgeB
MDYLDRNLSALSHLYPEFMARLCEAFSDKHLLKQAEGQVSYIHGLSSYSLNLSSGSIFVLREAVPAAAEVLLAGVGLGEHLLTLIQDSSDEIIWHVWDNDPALWREALSRYDLRVAIFSGKLKPYLGIDLVTHREKLSALPIVGHPILEHFYRLQLDFLKSDPRDKKCLLCEGELFVEDIAQTLRQQGYAIYPWATNRLSLDEVKRCLEIYQPDLVMAVNFRKGLGEVSKLTNAPVVCWEIDPAVDTPPEAPEHCNGLYIFTYRRPHVEDYKSSGYPNVRFLPLATNPATRHPLREAPDTPSPYRTSVSFVGASMLEQGRMLLQEFVNMYPSFLKPEATPRHADEILGILKTVIKKQRDDLSTYSLDHTLWEALPELKRPEPGTVDPEKLVSEICAAHKRMDWLQSLAPQEIAVWGDTGWKESTKLNYRGTAGHSQELTLIYSNSLINIDIGRLYQNDIMTMRLFDVMACQGFLLTEYNDEIVKWFEPGVHLDVYRTPEELAEKVQYYLQHPDKAHSIGQAAREKILENHTFSKRFEEIFMNLGSD